MFKLIVICTIVAIVAIALSAMGVVHLEGVLGAHTVSQIGAVLP